MQSQFAERAREGEELALGDWESRQRGGGKETENGEAQLTQNQNCYAIRPSEKKTLILFGSSPVYWSRLGPD